jgi:chorismate mutase/prephenate dehydratase
MNRRTKSNLPSLRKRIDQLDERVLKLLNQRAHLAQEIGRIKHQRQWPVFDAKREAFVLRHVMTATPGPLSPRAVRHIFQAILSECRRRQRRRHGT